MSMRGVSYGHANGETSTHRLVVGHVRDIREKVIPKSLLLCSRLLYLKAMSLSICLSASLYYLQHPSSFFSTCLVGDLSRTRLPSPA